MPNARKVLGALNVFVDEFGEDVDHFLNFSRLLDSKAILEEVRPIIERNISNEFLPGFLFEDDHHAAWFMKTYFSWPTWVSNYPIKPEKWDEHWARLILVPSKHHYISEVAAALQRYDQNTARTIREFKKIKKEGSEKDIRNAAKIFQICRSLSGLPPGPLKGERDLMAMGSWPKRLREKFPDFSLPENDTSIMRLAKNAANYRAERTKGDAKSGWQISQISYMGSIDNPKAKEPDKWEELTQNYFELWEWHPIDGVAPPKRTKLTFLEPAIATFWNPKWKKNKKSFRD